VTLVIVGASNDHDLEEALGVFVDAGFHLAADLSGWDAADGVLPLRADGARRLREADAEGVRYHLVHLGPDDGAAGGSFERAHHRVDTAGIRQLAPRLRSRERLLVTCLAFGFKKGMPEAADWVFDTRQLDNPYWVAELRPLDGRDAPVRDFVLAQPAARQLLDDVERTLAGAVPLYRKQGRSQVVVAFGCTGGRHRSVAVAGEMARRLRRLDGVDVEFAARDLA
jgi:UPF0042 nucleotide-binding protein